MDSVDNEQLYAAWVTGDEHAGHELIGRLLDDIRRFVRSMIAGPDLDDAVQEVFTRLAQRARRGDPVTNVKGFASGVARNVILELLRARAKHPIDFSQHSIIDIDPGQSERLLEHEEHHLLLKALHRMPIDDQILLGLRFWQRLSTREIAAILEHNPSTVRTRLQRAQVRLERLIGELAESPEARDSTLGSLAGWAREIGDMVDEHS